MSARRQPSSTSLSKFARVNSPDLSNRSLDFCNAFWGNTEGGVDVLFARMRGAARTVEEVRAFWKERASIEEEYSKRLSKLAKQVLGRDEIGELKNSLDTLKLETDIQANAHAKLAQQVRSELENPAGAFVTRQSQFKRTAQAAIEKAFKNKQTHEAYVTKAREKYEADCMRINSYTAQSTLVQGKDLEKIQLKLERARQTVTANERDFKNFARELEATVEKWERDWKLFCDACQDLEEERIEFMKDNVWAYANAVSTVCVSDDESCEKIRIALEQLEPERDMENFVRDYGTGNEIPDPPRFISYTNPESTASATARQAPRYAHYTRSSSRHQSMVDAMKAQPPEEEPIGPGVAGFGSGANVMSESPVAVSNHSRGGSVSSPANGFNGTSPPAVPTLAANAPPSSATNIVPGPPPFQHDPSGPATKTMIAIGSNAYEVDPSRDPQSVPNSARSGSTGPINPNVGSENDPLRRHMAELQSAGTGPMRRNSANITRPTNFQSPSPTPSNVPVQIGSALAAPPASTGQPQNRDYRNSAEFVVGGPPPGSRPTSPAGPPVAAHMMPPAQTPSSPLPVESVVQSYAQALPGERRASISRQNSPNLGPSHTHNQSLGQNITRGGELERPRSREGFAGIGSGGRTPSPGPSPSNNMNVNGAQPQPYRIPSPAPHNLDLGIKLDATGQVTHDLMAEQYRQQQQQHVNSQINQNHGSYGPQRTGSTHMISPVGPPPPVQAPYPPVQYQQPLPYMQPPPTQAQGPSSQHQPPGWQGHPMGSNVPGANTMQRVPSMNAHQNGTNYHQPTYYEPRRSPSPQRAAPAAPTGQWIDGKPVLFYVKALYDYQASIDEEFDFQAGDVIAVTSTPEDGWWTGVLLDDSRRIPGRTVFPSNFVCLF